MASLGGYLMGDDCGISPSALASLHLASSKEDVNTMNYSSTDNKFDAITMETGKVFKEYEFKPGEAEFKVDITVENRIPKFVITITFKAEKLSDSTLEMVDQFKDHSYCGMIGIAETFYGEKYVAGYDKKYGKKYGLELASSSLTTGRGLTGAQGGDIILTCEMPNRPVLLDNSVAVPV